MAVIEFFELFLLSYHESFLRVHFWKPGVVWLFTVCHSSFMQTNRGSLCVQHFKKCHVLQSFYEAVPIIGQGIGLDGLWCAVILLFCSLLYGDRFKCFGGTPVHPHVQHSPMASSPFPVPRKNDVIVNPDPTLIHIHSPSWSQTHAWTINSCTAINLAQREEKSESPRFRAKRDGWKHEDKRVFRRKRAKKRFLVPEK